MQLREQFLSKTDWEKSPDGYFQEQKSISFEDMPEKFIKRGALLGT